LELFKLLSTNASETRSKLNNFRNIPLTPTSGSQQSNNSNSPSPISAAQSPRDQALAKTLKNYKDSYSRKAHPSLKLFTNEEPQEKPKEDSPEIIPLNSPLNPDFLDLGSPQDLKKARTKRLTLIKSDSNPNPNILPIGSPRIKLPNDSLLTGRIAPLQPNKWGQLSNRKTLVDLTTNNPYLPKGSSMVVSPRTKKLLQNTNMSTTIFGFEEKIVEDLGAGSNSVGASPMDKKEFKKLRELINYKSVAEIQSKMRSQKKEREQVVNIHTQEPIEKSRRQTK